MYRIAKSGIVTTLHFYFFCLGNNTESEVDMKKAKNMTIIYYIGLKINRKEIEAGTGY